MTEEPAERRLAAILSADVAGYSRLMAADEEATVRRLAAYREQVTLLVRQHRGRLVDFTGDNFLAEFPSALDAVKAAAEIQRVLGARNASLAPDARMEFRIGVHMGDVRVEEGRLYGDGVNIAARLEKHAPPGGLCLSSAVHDQVAKRVDSCSRISAPSPEEPPAAGARFGARLSDSAKRVKPTARALASRDGGARCGSGARRARAWASWPTPLGWLFDAVGITALPESSGAPRPALLVVLPFANVSGDPAQEYFSDGITDELTTACARARAVSDLAQLGFHVQGRSRSASRTSAANWACAMCWRGACGAMASGCAYRLSSPRRARGFQVWSERYDRELTDVFDDAERDRGIHQRRRSGIEIRDEVRERIQAHPTEAIGAYEAYLAASANMRTNTRRGI